MSYILEPFQVRGCDGIIKLLSVFMSTCAVSPGGSGKTVMLSYLSNRFISNTDKSVMILVHREELLDQTRRKLIDMYGIFSTAITADTTLIQPSRVYVGMVETFHSRSSNQNFLNLFNNVGLLIVDEAHLGNFKKIYEHFATSKRIGFTATPISAVKKDPMNKYFQSIIIISKPSELIELNLEKRERGIVPAITYSLKNVDISKLKKKGNNFDEEAMGEEFSKKQQIENTLIAYLNYSYGDKTVCFNASIYHSKKMHERFLEFGLNSRHLDGNKNGEFGNPKYRKESFEWLHDEDDAILNNIGIATIGFDEPTIKTVILNSSMLSVSYYIQKSVRGSRPCKFKDGTYKDSFLLLDMGDNVIGCGHGLIDDDRPWEEYFNNPKIPTSGVGSVKFCPECGAMSFPSVRICTGKVENLMDDTVRECGYIFNVKSIEEDMIYRDLVRIGNDNINVSDNIAFFSSSNEYRAYHETISQVCATFWINRGESISLDSNQLDAIWFVAYAKSCEFFKLSGKRRWPNFKQSLHDKMIELLKKEGFYITVDDIIQNKTNQKIEDARKPITIERSEKD